MRVGGLSAELHIRSDALIIRLAGEFDALGVAVFERCLNRTLIGHNQHLIIDLLDLTYIDSSGLRAILRAKKLIAARRGYIDVVVPHAHTRKVLSVTGLDDLFGTFADRESALAAPRPGDARRPAYPVAQHRSA